ncbi:MAG: ABC transporter ATP-binding protein [Verrucomicrobiales bacterium]|jgi:ABC-2 type transport system ATP-binding protein|nr:ABC transporter ATP-binding protein [Verrucomicrobiales bacterium]MDF1785046.1 ABC transporter ATP-binding protein [Verrucomicrobiales bacterium]
MSETSAIEIKDLRVDYGNFVAVEDISLTIPFGEVYGLVGPNGAGKTSTFKVLATLMEQTYGEVRIAGHDVLEQTEAARRLLGYMPDLAPVPSDLKVWEFLNFHADTHALGSRRARLERVDECLARVNLTDNRESWCKKLSRGQTQRVVLAKTLLHRPQVLILDEPASGLDPLSRRELRHALQDLAKQGATVIVSSHILGELAEMCSSLCVMNQGKLLASGSSDQVLQELGNAERRITAVLASNQASDLSGWLETKDGVGEIERSSDSQLTFTFTGDEAAKARLLASCIQQNFLVADFHERGSSFEEILVEVAEGNRVS